MDATGLLILVSVLAVPMAVVVGWYVYSRNRVDKASTWPCCQATVESAAMETVANAEYSAVVLPVFAFSYVVDGDYHSGRFALRPWASDPGESILTTLLGRKLRIHYDPRRPTEWYIPDEVIEGCKVEQKIGVHVVDYSPK